MAHGGGPGVEAEKKKTMKTTFRMNGLFQGEGEKDREGVGGK